MLRKFVWVLTVIDVIWTLPGLIAIATLTTPPEWLVRIYTCGIDSIVCGLAQIVLLGVPCFYWPGHIALWVVGKEEA